MRLHLHAALVAAAASLAACTGAPSGHEPAATPAACLDTFSAARCANMTDAVSRTLDVRFDDVVAITVLPPPTPEVRNGVTVLVVRSGGPPVDTLVTLRDGSVHAVTIQCGGIPVLECQDTPQLRGGSVTGGGYFDTPEGATPVPSPDPETLAAATELHVARLDIPIDHDGRHEVPVGEARLPNGRLSEAGFDFISAAWPADMTIAGGDVALEVRSLDDGGRPINNVYDHGWVPGTERVEGVIVFEVVRHQPGAILSLIDIVVR